MAAPSVGPTVAPADVLSRGERTCLLLCDVQATIMAGVFGSENPSPVVTRMAELLERSRAAGLSTGFVAVQFREGERSWTWRRDAHLYDLSSAKPPRLTRAIWGHRRPSRSGTDL